MDAETIYNILENEIVPLYYARDAHQVPTGWVAAMKKCLHEISPRFTMKRMMDDYFNQYYNKMIERTNWMRANRYQKAFEIDAWKTRVRNNWDKVEVKSLILPETNVRPLTFGEQFVAEITLITLCDFFANRYLRAISSGRFINKDKVGDIAYEVSEKDIVDGKYILAQKGKKNYYLINING